jgi:hypothetical protein
VEAAQGAGLGGGGGLEWWYVVLVGVRCLPLKNSQF